MPDVTVERRSAPRYPMVLSVDVVELPRGGRLSARTSDISTTGCYIDTLNPIPQGSEVRLRITHNRGRLMGWLENRDSEFLKVELKVDSLKSFSLRGHRAQQCCGPTQGKDKVRRFHRPIDERIGSPYKNRQGSHLFR